MTWKESARVYKVLSRTARQRRGELVMFALQLRSVQVVIRFNSAMLRHLTFCGVAGELYVQSCSVEVV